MRKNFCGWEIAKTKANLRLESNMKVAQSTCERELGEMKSVDTNLLRNQKPVISVRLTNKH